MRYRSHRDLEVPHGNTGVWRYMSFEKFLDLLLNSHLFFANARTLTDQFEIKIPRATLDAYERKLTGAGVEGRDLEEELSSFQFQKSGMKGLTLLNCWTMEQHENFALWKIYLGGAKAGVAIRSTISRVRKAIEMADDPYSGDFYLGRVIYRSFIPPQELTRFALITTKYEFYSFEKELRFFYPPLPQK